ncbi:hypothetical protein Aperf_G00000028922 [Anoplocephala perfoliata]
MEHLNAGLCQLLHDLPCHQNWMQFLTNLTKREKEAAFNYYKVALKEVRLRGRCISSIHRLLALLRKEKSSDQDLISAVHHLTISNTTCESLCFDLWLRLLEMIIFLERSMPRKTIGKSMISAFHHLHNWQKELSDDDRRVWKVADENEPLTKRRKAEFWYSCLNDRILLEKLKTKVQSPDDTSSRHVPSENRQDLFKSTGKNIKVSVPEEPRLDLPQSTMSVQLSTKNGSQVDGDNQNSAIVSDSTEVGMGNTIRRIEDDFVSKPSDLPSPRRFDVSNPPHGMRNDILNTSTADDSGKHFRSPASTAHSEARKKIAGMSTGSDIVRTSSSELFLHGGVADNSKFHPMISYVAAAKKAEMFFTQPHSNSNVEIPGSITRKSVSDDRLLKAALARTQSLDDINGPHTDKTISLSHSLDDTTTYPFDTSEHLKSAWDDYQVPYYPSIERIDPTEPKAKFPETLFWEDLFPDETEALDFEQQLHRPQGTTRQIDEWSFEGLSSTPLSSPKVDEIADANDGISESSQALLEPADRDPFSEDGLSSLLRLSDRQDKCLQTEAKESIEGTFTPSAFLNNSQGALVHDTNTTHTSGYESGPDAVNSLLQRNLLHSTNNSGDISEENPSTPHASRNFGVQTVRNGHYRVTDAIKEESVESTFILDRVDPDCVDQSEQELVKLREFLREILVSSNNDEPSTTNTLVGNRRKRTGYSQAFTGPRSVYNLMKCFSSMLESAERNLKLLQKSGRLDPKQRDDLSDRWDVLAKWINSRTEELQELNNFREKIQELSAKVYVLNENADTRSQNTPMRSQTLANESQTLAEDAEALRDVILNRKIQTRNTLHPISPNSPELFDLNELFFECRNKILDRSLQDARSLAEQTNTLKSKFSYLEALSERLQTEVPTGKDVFLRRERGTNSHSSADPPSKPVSICYQNDNHRTRNVIRTLLKFFAIVVIILILYILPDRGQNSSSVISRTKRLKFPEILLPPNGCDYCYEFLVTTRRVVFHIETVRSITKLQLLMHLTRFYLPAQLPFNFTTINAA